MKIMMVCVVTKNLRFSNKNQNIQKFLSNIKLSLKWKINLQKKEYTCGSKIDRLVLVCFCSEEISWLKRWWWLNEFIQYTHVEVCVPKCLFPGTGCFFPDFPKQPDQKTVVLSRSCQFGKCPPVSSCLVSFKTSSGTQTSTLHRVTHCDTVKMKF